MNKFYYSKQSPKNRTIFFLVIIILIALIARIWISFYSGLPIFNTDTYNYFKMANGILTGTPISYFPNGYPLIVSIMKIMVGDAMLPFSLIVLNIVLSTLVVLMTFFVARKVLNTRLSLLATVVVGLWPSQLNYVRQLLTEVPSTFFLILGIFILTRKSDVLSILSGLMFFFTGLIRSTFSPFGFLAVIYLFVIGQSRKSLFLFLGILIGLMFSTILYQKEIILPSSNLGPNLLISINNYSTHNINWSLDAFSEKDKAAPLAKYSNFALENPSIFLQQRFSSLWELWGPWPASGDVETPRSTVARLLIGVRFPLLMLVIAAIWMRPKDPFLILFTIPIVLITLVHMAFFSTPRFIYPIEPLLIILAIVGARELWGRWGRERYAFQTPPQKNPTTQ